MTPELARVVSEVHKSSVCCFCRLPLVLIAGSWWCQTEACRDIQRRYAIAFREDNDATGPVESWFHVPLPKQAMVEMQTAPNVMYAGAAGPGKSHWGRRRLIRRAMAYEGYRGLIVRRQLTDVQSTHGSRMDLELKTLAAHGIITKRKEKSVEFIQTSSVIQFAHLSTQAALDSLLGPEYDDILLDEASTVNPDYLPQLMARARTTNPAVKADGGAKALPVTNPGGEASGYLRDMFITHTPDFEKYPQLVTDYKPEDWVYIEATLDDNPYLEDDYATKRLANLSGTRYKQLRYADWDTFEGQFFTQWQAKMTGQLWHVQEVTLR